MIFHFRLPAARCRIPVLTYFFDIMPSFAAFCPSPLPPPTMLLHILYLPPLVILTRAFSEGEAFAPHKLPSAHTSSLYFELIIDQSPSPQMCHCRVIMLQRGAIQRNARGAHSTADKSTDFISHTCDHSSAAAATPNASPAPAACAICTRSQRNAISAHFASLRMPHLPSDGHISAPSAAIFHA